MTSSVWPRTIRLSAVHTLPYLPLPQAVAQEQLAAVRLQAEGRRSLDEAAEVMHEARKVAAAATAAADAAREREQESATAAAVAAEAKERAARRDVETAASAAEAVVASGSSPWLFSGDEVCAVAPTAAASGVLLSLDVAVAEVSCAAKPASAWAAMRRAAARAAAALALSSFCNS